MSFASFVLDGKNYVLEEAASLEELSEDKVHFCGVRRGDKFYRVLYVGSDVGIIARNKAQLQKNAPFNAMPGGTDVEKSSLV